jgi:putative ABC transport system substrate-binding protein
MPWWLETSPRLPLLGNPSAAKTLGVRLLQVDVRDVADYEAAFEVAVKERVGAALISPYLPFPKETAAFALRHRLPTMTLMGSVDPVGQLIAYGANFGEQVRRVASHVDRILKGAKPADLPVEQPTKFELVINLKTAQALGLTIPQTLVLRACVVMPHDYSFRRAQCPSSPSAC